MLETWRLLPVIDLSRVILWSSLISIALSLAPPNISWSNIRKYIDEESQLAERLLKNYDKRFIPAKKGRPLNITLQVVVADILSIDNMEAEMLVYIKQTWRDHRLSRNATKILKVREHFLDKIWLPDTRIINLKEAKRFEGFGGINMNIYPKGTVYFSQLALIKTSCLMDLHKFPMDRQTCFLNFSTFAYSKSLLHYITKGKHVVIKHSKIPQFDLVGTKEIETGSRVAICLTFQRRSGYYIMTIYIPSASITILSWLAFLMDPTNIADRLTLEITLTLTTVFLLNGINESITHVSYAKASDVFVIVSFGFIFLALLETMLVFRLSFQKSSRRVRKCTCHYLFCRKGKTKRNLPRVDDEREKLKDEPAVKCCCTSLSTWIDKICVILFPTMYITFNIIYWKYYTNVK